MKDSFTQSMDWLHTWGGLVCGWLLFAIFLTGTLTVFDKEITHWMQPELHHIEWSQFDLDSAAKQLARLAPDAEHWWIEFPHTRVATGTIRWEQNESRFEQRLNPATGDILSLRATRGGEFFYRFHYQLHLQTLGVWIVGFAAMVMLVALVTGIVIHHRIFQDFFTFRPHGVPHRAWLDAHNATGVLVLPFHVVITFTGLVIMWTIYMPAGIHVFYSGAVEALYRDLEDRIERKPEHSSAQMTSLKELEARARTYWKGGVTEVVEVIHPGDRAAIVHVTRRADDRLALISDRVTFDGVSGELLQVWTGDHPAYVTYSVLLGLHYLWFQHDTIRWLYFFMGLSASAMIATGLVLWVVKRKGSHADDASYWLVEALNVAAIAGLLTSIAVFFWCNRLLPIDVADRALRETQGFYLTWSICAVHSAIRGGSSFAWKEQCYLAAGLFILLPFVNMITTDSHLLVTIPNHNWKVASVDVTSLAAGAMLFWIAQGIGRPKKSDARGSTDKEQS